MSNSTDQSESFYTAFFTKDPYWSTPFPNPDEARRWAKIGEYLSDIAHPREMAGQPRLRILDVGCGRGWLTHQASTYGQCDGIDPVAGSIEEARRLHPELSFRAGMMGDLLRDPSFKPYDVVICSEVIEHVHDKDAFVAEIRESLVAGGYLILTTPRLSLFRKWLKLGPTLQPVEAWISERGLRRLFVRHGFKSVAHNRAYVDLGCITLLHRLCRCRTAAAILERTGCGWLRCGMLYSAALYQVWLFRRE